MFSSKRKTLLAAVVALCAVAVPVAVTGTAHAQSGSRLCGVIWQSKTFRAEVITRIYETPKKSEGGESTCDRATANNGGPGGSPFGDLVRDKDFNNWVSLTFQYEKCEPWRDRPLDKNGFGGMDPEFVGDGWPAKDNFNICNNMNRSDTVFDMQAYWLYNFASEGKPTKFQRG